MTETKNANLNHTSLQCNFIKCPINPFQKSEHLGRLANRRPRCKPCDIRKHDRSLREEIGDRAIAQVVVHQIHIERFTTILGLITKKVFHPSFRRFERVFLALRFLLAYLFRLLLFEKTVSDVFREERRDYGITSLGCRNIAG